MLETGYWFLRILMVESMSTLQVLLVVLIQDESHHHAFKPGIILFLDTQGMGQRAK
jgi:hypothetical protein